MSDSARFAEKARAAGVETTLEIEEGLIHGRSRFAFPEGAETYAKRIGAFIARNC